MAVDLLIRNADVIFPNGRARKDIAASGGKIVCIGEVAEAPDATRTIDAVGKIVLPGLIDPHVHIGLGNGDTDWRTETRSAAAGGITATFSFLMSGEGYIPILEDTLAVAARSSVVDYGLHIVPCTQQHLDEMPRYVADYGVTSYKFFTSFRGDEGAYLGIAGTDDGYMLEYFEHIRSIPGGIACIHPENIEIVWKLRARLQAAGRDDLPAWDEARPDYVEAEAIARSAFYAAQTGCPVYFVHLSGRAAVDEVRYARKRYPDIRIWAETCPHYLTHTKDAPLGSLGKVNPPLRTQDDIDAVWEAIIDGTIDTVASDHVPRVKAKKSGSIWTGSAGFPGIACIVPVLLSEGHHKRGLSIERIVDLMATAPATAMGVSDRKGAIRLGGDADFTIIDPELTRTVTPEIFQSQADYSIYDGWEMKGWPVATIVRGNVVMEDGVVSGQPGSGEYLARKD